jgi:hypothetical protein
MWKATYKGIESWHLINHQQSEGNVCGNGFNDGNQGHSCGAHWYAENPHGPWLLSVEPAYSVRCAFFDGNLHLRMPLVPTPDRLKLLHACDQWHSSREVTALIGWQRKFRPNTEANVTLANGTEAQFQTRQRPQLVFGEDGQTPSFLFTSGSFEGNNPDLNMTTHTFAHAFKV